MLLLLIGEMQITSSGFGGLPVVSNWSVITDDFSVGSPNCEDGFFAADSSASGVSTWPEPMILRSSSGPGAISSVGDSIDGLSKHAIQEEHVVGDNSCSQMVWEIVTALDNSVNVLITIRNDELERTE